MNKDSTGEQARKMPPEHLEDAAQAALARYAAMGLVKGDDVIYDRIMERLWTRA
jgi:hypothetical protein